MSQVFSEYIDHIWPTLQDELSSFRPTDSRRVLGKTRRSLWLNRHDFKYLGTRGGKSRFRTWARPIFEYERREFIRESLQRRDELRAFRQHASVSPKSAPRLLRKLTTGGQAVDGLLTKLGKKQPKTVHVIKQWLGRKPVSQICQKHGLTQAQFRRQLGEFLELIDEELCYLNRIECGSLNHRIVFESLVHSAGSREPRKRNISPIIKRQARELHRQVVRIDVEPIKRLLSAIDSYSPEDKAFVGGCLENMCKMFDQLSVDMDNLAREMSFITEAAPGLLDSFQGEN